MWRFAMWPLTARPWWKKTYAQYVQDIRRVVTYLRGAIPDIKGKRVALLSKNCYEYGVNAFGIILAGGVVVTLNQKKDLAGAGI